MYSQRKILQAKNKKKVLSQNKVIMCYDNNKKHFKQPSSSGKQFKKEKLTKRNYQPI